jgi:hypothetical protein
MAKLTLTYDRNDPNLPTTTIAKLLPSRESARETVQRLNVFEREIKFYTDVAPMRSIRTPKLFYSAIDVEKQRYVMLLEDCSYAAEADSDLQGLTLEQTKIIVSELADFHSRWWNAETNHPFSWMPKVKERLKAALPRFRPSWDASAKLEIFRNALPEGGWEAGIKMCEQRSWLIDDIPESNLTIVHNDLRADNMFFDWADKQEPLIIFDWGLAAIGRSTIMDLSYLLGFNLEPKLRRRVESNMLKLYHEHLLDKGIHDYPLSECWSDYRRGLLLRATMPIDAFLNTDLNEARGSRLVTTTLHRWFLAIVDNDATSILP